MSAFEVEEFFLPKPNFVYITRGEDVAPAVAEILRYSMIEVDTETTGFDPYTKKIVLVQIGIPNKSFVFDIRCDTEHSTVHIDQLAPVLNNPKILKLLQNAVFDMKMLKVHAGYYLENIYDTMLVEQLFNLGVNARGAGLKDLVKKYLGLSMTKEPGSTFQDYNQKFKPYQIEYAANDVAILTLIRELQLPRIHKEGFDNVCRLEFEFTKPMCEMELNGITLDVPKWRIMMKGIEQERNETQGEIHQMLSSGHGQNILFGIPIVNVDSPSQLLKALRTQGIKLDSTAAATLGKYKDIPIVEKILSYRKLNKLMSTYGETLLEKIHPLTGRLHTRFRQMVSTGRMSSSAPNLQNIPKKQRFRSCFVAKPGYSLVTADMSGAELRILGNISEDTVFIECYANGIDLHTRTASEVFGIPMDEVKSDARGKAKAINFGLCYGLSKYGLAARLKIKEKEADGMINTYFERYSGIKTYLEEAARGAVKNGFSQTISGRKRFYNIPPYGHPDRVTKQRAVERAAKNAGIQGANADTVKEAMILVVDRLEASGHDAKLLLTVHDEVVVEVRDDQVEQVRDIVSQSLIDGFGKYFSKIPMETDALLGPCWLKGSCENESNGKGNGECGCCDMKFVEDERFGTKLVCAKCGAPQE